MKRIIYFLSQWNKVLNKISCYKNRIIFNILGIKYGFNCIVHGHVGIKLFNNSEVIIGDNFYYSSGRGMNPLCANNEGYICVEDGAKLIIGNNVAISSTKIWAHEKISIGDNVLLGGGVTILDSDCHSLSYSDRQIKHLDCANKKNKPIIIEKDVLVGMNCIILKGVTIGARSVIGANSVVTKDIPADSLVCGNPAKVIKSFI